MQHLINIPAPNLLKLTNRKRDIHERKYVKWGMVTLTQYRVGQKLGGSDTQALIVSLPPNFWPTLYYTK